MRYGSIKVLLVAAACIAAPQAAPAAHARHAGPVIALVPANSNPDVPAGLKVTCMQGPNVLDTSRTCPVVKYLGNTTWAYSFIDNRVALALVTYDAQGNVVGNITKNGARYVYAIASSADNQTVTFSGQSDQSVLATWSELAPADTGGAAPYVATVPANSNPPVPAGLKVTCMVDGTTLNPSPTCPVFKYRGITTWAYSFIDNRVAMAFVSYDAKNRVIRNATLNGSRYVWQMVYDPASQTVTASGQVNANVTAPLSQLGP